MAQTTIVGNLGKDPEVKHSQRGNAYARFSIAWSERYKGPQGDWIDGPTVWVSVTVFNALAEAMTDLHKGHRVIVSGDLVPELWSSEQGEQTVFTMRANHVGPDLTFQQVQVQKRDQQQASQDWTQQGQQAQQSAWNGAQGRQQPTGGFSGTSNDGQPPF